MSKVILISGKGEAGKSTFSKILKEELENYGRKSLIVPFAGYLKFVAKEYFGWSGKKDEEGRTLLQKLGTEIVRQKNPNFWVETVGRFVDLFSDEFDFFLVDDCRFPEELLYFTKNRIENLSIRIERIGHVNSLTEEQKKHQSEIALDNYDFDLYIYCETGIEKLREEVKNTVNNLESFFGVNI